MSRSANRLDSLAAHARPAPSATPAGRRPCRCFTPREGSCSAATSLQLTVCFCAPPVVASTTTSMCLRAWRWSRLAAPRGSARLGSTSAPHRERWARPRGCDADSTGPRTRHSPRRLPFPHLDEVRARELLARSPSRAERGAARAPRAQLRGDAFSRPAREPADAPPPRFRAAAAREMAAPMLAPVFDRKRSSSGICKPKTASKCK